MPINDEAKALSYHDILLRQADLAILRDQSAWLNDQACFGVTQILHILEVTQAAAGHLILL